jgi:hypothetical protein
MTQPNLRDEADYWNNAYKECYGAYPDPLIGAGVAMAHVAAVQSAVMRYWTHKAKEAATRE